MIGATDPRGRPATRRGGYQAGFSLVEVLVAVFVLSVGMLGLAALQVAGLRSNESAQQRTDVTLAAYDVIDRLRADPRSLFTGATLVQSIPGGTCASPIDGTDAVARWRRAFCALGLPAPDAGDAAVVDCQDDNACGADNCEILFRWNDDRGEREILSETRDAASLEFRVCTRLAAAS